MVRQVRYYFCVYIQYFARLPYPPCTLPTLICYYYLQNFHRVLGWLQDRYGDLLQSAEYAFIQRFSTLPECSLALLIRMVMRKGSWFRTSKLKYDKIGCLRAASQPLIECGWLVTVQEVAALLRIGELREVFANA